MVLGKWDNHMQKNDIGPLSYNHTQKWTQNYNDFNMRHGNHKAPRKNIDARLLDIGFDDDFLNLTPKA